jgi:colicin import membrane protein
MSTELVEIPKENAMTVFTQESGLDSYVKQVADEVAGFKHDMKTAASRGRTISLASKVAKIKVMYDDCGKDLVAGWKESAKKVDASRKKMRDQLDELKVLARKPVTDWE